MNNILSPIDSEFDTRDQAEAHDRWFRAQVQASLDDARPCVPHDEVMAEVESIIVEAQTRLQAKPG